MLNKITKLNIINEILPSAKFIPPNRIIIFLEKIIVKIKKGKIRIFKNKARYWTLNIFAYYPQGF